MERDGEGVDSILSLPCQMDSVNGFSIIETGNEVRQVRKVGERGFVSLSIRVVFGGCRLFRPRRVAKLLVSNRVFEWFCHDIDHVSVSREVFTDAVAKIAGRGVLGDAEDGLIDGFDDGGFRGRAAAEGAG